MSAETADWNTFKLMNIMYDFRLELYNKNQHQAVPHAIRIISFGNGYDCIRLTD